MSHAFYHPAIGLLVRLCGSPPRHVPVRHRAQRGTGAGRGNSSGLRGVRGEVGPSAQSFLVELQRWLEPHIVQPCYADKDSLLIKVRRVIEILGQMKNEDTGKFLAQGRHLHGLDRTGGHLPDPCGQCWDQQLGHQWGRRFGGAAGGPQGLPVQRAPIHATSAGGSRPPTCETMARCQSGE